MKKSCGPTQIVMTTEGGMQSSLMMSLSRNYTRAMSTRLCPEKIRLQGESATRAEERIRNDTLTQSSLCLYLHRCCFLAFRRRLYEFPYFGRSFIHIPFVSSYRQLYKDDPTIMVTWSLRDCKLIAYSHLLACRFRMCQYHWPFVFTLISDVHFDCCSAAAACNE